MQSMQESYDAPDFEQLVAFVAVAEARSFVKAAQRLGKDASVLSRRVTQLEAQLGVRLLHRTTRSVTLTEIGKTYHERVSMLLEELGSANLEASDSAATPRGLLRITLPCAYGRLWVAPLIPKFLAQYPQVRIDARFSDRFTDMVAEEFDLAVRVGVMRDSTLTARKLADYRNVLVASPEYLDRHGVPQHPTDLLEHVCLGFTSHVSWPDWHLTRGGKRYTLHPQGQLISDSSELLLLAAIQGTGIAYTPDWLASGAIADGRLVEVLSDDARKPDGGIFLIFPPGRFVPAKTRVFADMLAQSFI